eukprot:PhF_6_TR33620/c0_g1_i1/m.49100
MIEIWLHRISQESDELVPATIQITAERTVFGRDGDVRIDSVEDPGRISRQHAIVDVENRTRMFVRDISMNGIVINDRSVPRNIRVELFHEDLITFSPFTSELTYRVEVKGNRASQDETKVTSRFSSKVMQVHPRGGFSVTTLESVIKNETKEGVPMEDRLASLTTYLYQRNITEENANETVRQKEIDRARIMYQYINMTYDLSGDVFKHGLGAQALHDTVTQVCMDVEAILLSGPMLVTTTGPAYILGDLHGSFRDLKKILSTTMPFHDLEFSPAKLIFLGDYVDRGPHGLEVILTLFCLKIMFPEKVILLRGNHEDSDINGDMEQYGDASFRSQMMVLLGQERGTAAWNTINRVFTHLPLACIINKSIFACHGGVPRVNSTQKSESRYRELRDTSFPHFNKILPVESDPQRRCRLREIARDLLWSDPCEDETKLGTDGFGPSLRSPDSNVTVEFGATALEEFLADVKCDILIRAHQQKKEGLRLAKGNRVLTVFSSSGYCYSGNSAGVAFVDEMQTVQLLTFVFEQSACVPRKSPPRVTESKEMGGKIPKRKEGVRKSS